MPFDVKPRDPAAAAPAAPAGDDVLSKIPLEDPNFDPMTVPLVAAVANADVPGVLLSEADLSRPELEPLAKNGRAIFEKTPVSIYSGKSGVALFNPAVVTPEEVQKLDKAGKLDKILAPASKFLGGGAAEAGGEPGLPALGGVAAPPMSSGAQTKIAGSRARATGQPNLPPTRQPVPGGGSLLNQFVRSPV